MGQPAAEGSGQGSAVSFSKRQSDLKASRELGSSFPCGDVFVKKAEKETETETERRLARLFAAHLQSDHVHCCRCKWETKMQAWLSPSECPQCLSVLLQWVSACNLALHASAEDEFQSIPDLMAAAEAAPLSTSAQRPWTPGGLGPLNASGAFVSPGPLRAPPKAHGAPGAPGSLEAVGMKRRCVFLRGLVVVDLVLVPMENRNLWIKGVLSRRVDWLVVR